MNVAYNCNDGLTTETAKVTMSPIRKGRTKAQKEKDIRGAPYGAVESKQWCVGGLCPSVCLREQCELRSLAWLHTGTGGKVFHSP